MVTRKRYVNGLSMLRVPCAEAAAPYLGKRWLLIWDNVENFDHIRSYWPSSRGSLILTTRYKSIAFIKGESIAMEPLNFEEAWELFTTLMKWEDLGAVPESEIEAAKSLLPKLQRLPLGIRQMAAMITLQRQGVKQYLETYKEVGHKDAGSFMLDDYEFSLDTVWKASFSALEEHRNEGSHGYHLLGIIASLSPADIPNELFTGHKLETYPPVLSFCQNEDE